ncbi:unnamed protein product [Adineta steineri]|uniref:Uncharacterized protein n=1 Tax=Adineta steineri TaxID=433720 RepID=A0A814H6Z8_9BILA|nr:unnamed protein product [Adineta steineri]CAF1230271.1 unnamed protein product [Adineta steineri]CAF1302221.1 unnamed protein product [Adineta steineri]
MLLNIAYYHNNLLSFLQGCACPLQGHITRPLEGVGSTQHSDGDDAVSLLNRQHVFEYALHISPGQQISVELLHDSSGRLHGLSTQFSLQHIPLQHCVEDLQADLSFRQLAFNGNSFGRHSTTIDDKTIKPTTNNNYL